MLLDDQFPSYTAAELQFLADYKGKGADPAKDSSWRGFLEWMITNTPPERPIPVSPADGATVARNPVLSAGAFLDRDGNEQAGSQWQVSTLVSFASPVWDSGASGPALAWVQVPSDILAAETRYYWRVRYRDDSGDTTTEWSRWSDEDDGALRSLVTGADTDRRDDDHNGVVDAVDEVTHSGKPLGTGSVRVSGRSLRVAGQPYQIRAVGYQPTLIGQVPGSPGYVPCRHEQYDRDLPLLRAMGCNTLRTWGKVDNDDGFLDACWNDGMDPIRVIAGFWVDPATDFANASVRAAITAEFRAYVQAYKGHPAILMWLPGGEINYTLRDNAQRLHDWFMLLNGLGWAAFEVEGNTYHPVTTDFAADVWDGATYGQDLLTGQLGIPEFLTDDAQLTGIDVWGFNCYRGETFAATDDGKGAELVVTPSGVSGEGLKASLRADGASLFAEFAARSAKPMWISEFGVDAWDHGGGEEDQATQAGWGAALWQEITANDDVCAGGSVMAWSDEWWKNRVSGTAATHDPGPWERGDQPDGWSDEEYYGIVSLGTGVAAGTVAPRLAYYALGQAWGADWPPTCAWGSSPVAGEWYAGDVRLEATATDPSGNDTIAQVEFQYALDSTDGADGTWQSCGPPDTEEPFALVWPSQPAAGAERDVWLRTRAVDTAWGYSAWVSRRIGIDNSYTGLIFDPHPGETGSPISSPLVVTFASVVSTPGGGALVDADLPSLLSLSNGAAAVPFTATVTTVGRGHTVITVTPSVVLDGVTTYILTLTGDLIDADLNPIPHASLTFTTTYGPPARLAFLQQPGGGQAGVSWSRQPRVAVCDAQGNTVESSTDPVTLALTAAGGTLAGTRTVTAADGSADFVDLWIDRVGEYRLSATAAGLAGEISAAFTIAPGALDHFSVSGVESPVMAGVRTSPRVTACDAWDNVKTDYVGAVSFTSSDPLASLPLPYTFYAAENGTHLFGFRVSFRTCGSQTLRAQDGSASGEQAGVVVTNAPPRAPMPVSPLNDAYARVVATLTAGPFSDTDGSGHAASQWQVAADADFTGVVWDSGETTALTTVTVPAGALAPGTPYSWRVRYKDDSDDPASRWGAWSDAVATGAHFVTSYPLPFTDNFATDKRWSGLSGDGGTATLGWQRGPATAGGGLFGSPDPALDHSGGADNEILGYAIGADYPETMSAAEVVSPALDCTGQSVVELSFWRWLGVDDDEWAHARVYTSNDGATWTPVWVNPATPVSDAGWTLVTYDITPVAADQPHVFIKFGMGPMITAYPYCGWNIDDLQVCAGGGDLARVWLETNATEVQVGADFQVSVYVQEDSPAAEGFRGGPLDVQFSADQVQYSGTLDSNTSIRPPFNAIRTSGALHASLIDELGGVTTQSGLGDGSPVLYAVLTFRATATGAAVFTPLAGSCGLSLGPPVGQIGIWRVDYGPPVSVRVIPYVAPPLVEVTLDGPGGAVGVGEVFDVRVWVRETSVQALGFLGGPLDLYFDPVRVRYHGSFDSAVVIQPPFNALAITNGALRETRIDELGGVTLASGYGDGIRVLYAVLRFEATGVGNAEFRAAPGESGLALSQPVGQVSIGQADYGAPLAVHVGNIVTVSVSADPPAAGTVAGGGVYDVGASVTVSAVPAVGYHFVNWTEAGSDVSGAATYEFTATTARSLTAHFAINGYPVAFVAGAHGTLTGSTSQTVAHGGNAADVTAVPNTGYHFVRWALGGSTYSTANPLTVTTVTAGMTFTAEFAVNSYTVAFVAGTHGTLTGATPQTVAHSGSTSAVTAAPDVGYHFVRWTQGGVLYDTANPLTVTNVTAEATLTAEFEVNTYTVAFAAGANGTLTGSTSQLVNHGANATVVTAVANSGYHFVRWLRAGSLYSTANPLTVTTVTASLTLTAEFATSTYTVIFQAGIGGTLTGTTPQEVAHGGTCSAVRAVANAGYHFVRWTQADALYNTANPLTVADVTAEMTLTAEFAADTVNCTVTFLANANGTLTGTTSQTVAAGDAATPVQAVANPGYHFVRWTSGGASYSTANPLTLTNVSADKTLTAEFAINRYTVTFVAGANGTLTGVATQAVDHGGACSAVSAVANAGYHFVCWRLGAAEYGTANPLTVTNVTAEMTLTAEFAFGVVTHTVAFVAGSGGRIDGPATQVVLHGSDTTEVTATALHGFVFTQWSDGPTESRRTVTNVLTDHTYTALFQTADAVPPNGSFLAVVDATEAGMDRGIWDLTGSYNTTVAGNPLVMHLVHEPTGRLSGTATYSVGKVTAVAMPIKGSLKGVRGSVTMKCAMEGSNGDESVTFALKLNLTVDTVARQLAGRMIGTVKANRVTTEVDDPLALALPAPMDGTWTLRFQLGQAGRAVTGTAELVLSNQVKHAFAVSGRTGADTVLDLQGDPGDPASKTISIRTTITPLEGGWARLESFSGRGSGQRIAW